MAGDSVCRVGQGDLAAMDGKALVEQLGCFEQYFLASGDGSGVGAMVYWKKVVEAAVNAVKVVGDTSDSRACMD